MALAELERGLIAKRTGTGLADTSTEDESGTVYQS